jgi:hypothetical protein
MAPDPGKTAKATPISAVLRGCGNFASFGVAAAEAFLEICAGRWDRPVKVEEPKASPVENAASCPVNDYTTLRRPGWTPTFRRAPLRPR